MSRTPGVLQAQGWCFQPVLLLPKTFCGRVPGSLQGTSECLSWLVLHKLHQSLLMLAGHDLLQPLPLFLYSPEGWDSGGGHCWFRGLNTSCLKPVCIRPLSMGCEKVLCVNPTLFPSSCEEEEGLYCSTIDLRAGVGQFLLAWHSWELSQGSHTASREKCALLSHSCALLLSPGVWVSLD